MSCFDPQSDDLIGLPETFLDLDRALGMNTGILFLSLAPGVMGVAVARGLWGRLPAATRKNIPNLRYVKSQ